MVKSGARGVPGIRSFFSGIRISSFPILFRDFLLPILNRSESFQETIKTQGKQIWFLRKERWLKRMGNQGLEEPYLWRWFSFLEFPFEEQTKNTTNQRSKMTPMCNEAGKGLLYQELAFVCVCLFAGGYCKFDSALRCTVHKFEFAMAEKARQPQGISDSMHTHTHTPKTVVLQAECKSSVRMLCLHIQKDWDVLAKGVERSWSLRTCAWKVNGR